MSQVTPEWFAARCGKVGASRIGDIVATTKSGWGASRANYMAELIAERLTGRNYERYQSPEMKWGLDNEAPGRDAYQFYADVVVEQCWFILHPTIAESGASPDGLVGTDGLVEIKCPNTATHIETILWGGMPHRYVPQMQWQMACTGRKWCDFVSFDPRMPEHLRVFCFRVARDEKRIAELEAAVKVFLAELNTKLTVLIGQTLKVA